MSCVNVIAENVIYSYWRDKLKTVLRFPLDNEASATLLTSTRLQTYPNILDLMSRGMSVAARLIC